MEVLAPVLAAGSRAVSLAPHIAATAVTPMLQGYREDIAGASNPCSLLSPSFLSLQAWDSVAPT